MGLAQAIDSLRCHYCGPKLDCISCVGLAHAVREFIRLLPHILTEPTVQQRNREWASRALLAQSPCCKCDPGPPTPAERADLRKRLEAMPYHHAPG